jgi:hypothetical protein
MAITKATASSILKRTIYKDSAENRGDNEFNL